MPTVASEASVSAMRSLTSLRPASSQTEDRDGASPFAALLKTESAAPLRKAEPARAELPDRAAGEAPETAADPDPAGNSGRSREAVANSDTSPGTADAEHADAPAQTDTGTGDGTRDPSEAAGAAVAMVAVTPPAAPLAPAATLAPDATATATVSADGAVAAAPAADADIAAGVPLQAAAAAAEGSPRDAKNAKDVKVQAASASAAGNGAGAPADDAAQEPLAATKEAPITTDAAPETGKDEASAAAPARPEAAAKPQSEAEAPRPDWQNDNRAFDLKPQADPAQSANPATAHAPSAQAATGAQADPQAQQATAAVPLAGLAVEIAAQTRAGKNRFEIRLDPPELGRIDVRLDVDREGNVTSRLVVERAETLDLLRRDAHALERALNQAGLKTADNALQFSLRDQNAGQNQDGQNAPSRERLVIADEDTVHHAPVRGYGLPLGQGKGLDIRI